MKHFLIVAGFFFVPLILMIAMTNGWFQAEEPNHAPVVRGPLYNVPAKVSASKPAKAEAWVDSEDGKICAKVIQRDKDAFVDGRETEPEVFRIAAAHDCTWPTGQLYNVSQILKVFADNEIKAEQRLMGRIRIVGVIKSIETNAVSGARLTFERPFWRNDFVVCTIREDAKLEFMNWHPGQRVVVDAWAGRRWLQTAVVFDCRGPWPATPEETNYDQVN